MAVMVVVVVVGWGVGGGVEEGGRGRYVDRWGRAREWRGKEREERGVEKGNGIEGEGDVRVCKWVCGWGGGKGGYLF